VLPDPLLSAYNSLKNTARRRGIDVSLTFREYKEIEGAYCMYCGEALDWVSGKASNLDRMDNGLGYDNLNCVPCCKFCNRIKGSFVPPNIMVEFGRVIRSAGGWGEINTSGWKHKSATTT
jgi:hypothetical protein